MICIKRHPIGLFFILFFFFITLISFSQDSLYNEPVLSDHRANQSQVETTEKLSKEQWNELTKGVSYSEHEEKREEKQKKRIDPPKNFSMPSLSGGVAQVIFYTIVILVLAFILYKVFSGQRSTASKTITNSEFNIETIEENLMEVDLYPLLEKAVLEKDFRAAIRIYYLLAIQELSNKKLIVWEKDKTNSEYIAELNTTPYFSGFRKNTIAYESVWFGNSEMDENRFNQLSPAFKQFIEQLKSKGGAGEKE